MHLVKTRATHKHLENSDMEVPGQTPPSPPPHPRFIFCFVLEIFLHLSWLGFKVSLGWGKVFLPHTVGEKRHRVCVCVCVCDIYDFFQCVEHLEFVLSSE